MHDTVLDSHVSGELVESEALAEDVAEIERESALQRLQ